MQNVCINTPVCDSELWIAWTGGSEGWATGVGGMGVVFGLSGIGGAGFLRRWRLGACLGGVCGSWLGVLNWLLNNYKH